MTVAQQQHIARLRPALIGGEEKVTNGGGIADPPAELVDDVADPHHLGGQPVIGAPVFPQAFQLHRLLIEIIVGDDDIIHIAGSAQIVSRGSDDLRDCAIGGRCKGQIAPRRNGGNPVSEGNGFIHHNRAGDFAHSMKIRHLPDRDIIAAEGVDFESCHAFPHRRVEQQLIALGKESTTVLHLDPVHVGQHDVRIGQVGYADRVIAVHQGAGSDELGDPRRVAIDIAHQAHIAQSVAVGGQTELMRAGRSRRHLHTVQRGVRRYSAGQRKSLRKGALFGGKAGAEPFST
ncbi:MAG: hypothetical protein BWY83_02187 [bacterium ADurb.Bin478]|nr:MAG: hypothetical protein BWY83_02187 [bacterium ADurb.Bin478]